MDAPPDADLDEVEPLTRHFDDLVRIMALATPEDRRPTQIASTYANALLEMLRLSFVYMRFHDSAGALGNAVVWLADGASCTDEDIAHAIMALDDGPCPETPGKSGQVGPD